MSEIGKKKASGKKKPVEKDPEGGLTAAGRKVFAEKEGSHLRPGVQGPADTPEKMVRKGSFLRRHFANPRGPMERDGEPTRLALSAHAWGEPVPETMGDAKQLAAKGHELLERYHAEKEGAGGKKKKKAALGKGEKAGKKAALGQNDKAEKSAVAGKKRSAAKGTGAAKKVAASSGAAKKRPAGAKKTAAKCAGK